MGYSKKILILNEVTKGFGIGAVKGVATIEQINSRTQCSIEIFNLKDISKGIFAFGVTSDNCPVYTQRLGLKGKISTNMPLGEIDLKGNLYCVLCYISDENIIPIAWGANNAKKLWETNILDGFKNIFRPAMFAGQVEKVEFKKENLEKTQKPQAINANNHFDNTDQKPNYIQHYRTASSTQNVYQKPSPKPVDSFFEKPLSMPKITIAKVSKIIDEAEKEYQDNKIAQKSYYPQDIKLKDVQKESAAASQAVQDAMQQPSFYKAFEQVPQELVDTYSDEQENYIKNNFGTASVHHKTEQKDQTQATQFNTPKNQDLTQQGQELFQVYYYQENPEDIDQQEDYEPRYIKSWGQYNNIKVKEQDHMDKDQDKERDQAYEQEQSTTQDNNDNYFLSVKDQLDKLFENNPPEEKLNNLMPDTYWVKVEIGQNQYYVVGLIGEGPDYIGYGVPGVFSVNPPKELQGYCKWLALDKDNPKGEGYWMMYQDAENGQSINLDLI